MRSAILILFIIFFHGKVNCETLDTIVNSYQNPARTSDNAKVARSKNLDGSTGRYKKNHKTVNGKKFGRSWHKMKTVKPSNDQGKEKQKLKSKS